MKGRWYVIMLSLDMFLYTKKNALEVFFYFYFPFSYFNFLFFYAPRPLLSWKVSDEK